MLGKNGHDVELWSALPQEIEMIQTHRELIDKLPGVKIPDNVVATSDLEATCKDKDLLVFAVASPYVRQTAKNAKQYIKDGQLIVNVGKGIEADTLDTLTDIIEEEIPQCEIAVLSGPSHAEEVSRDIPTSCVVGAKSKKSALLIQDIF